MTTHPAAYCSIAGTRGESREDASPGVTRGANATRASPRFDARPESWAFLLPARARRRCALAACRHLACTRDAARKSAGRVASTKKGNVSIARRLFATTQKLLHPDCARLPAGATQERREAQRGSFRSVRATAERRGRCDEEAGIGCGLVKCAAHARRRAAGARGLVRSVRSSVG